MLKIYVDASTKGNPGPSGIGIQLIDGNHYLQLNYPLSDMSNHQAEFVAMEAGLTEAIERGLNDQTTFVYSDSKVVCETIDKNFTQNETFKPYLKRIQQLIPKFDLIIIQWIPERQNKGADNLARQGLQKALHKIEKEA
ncbi:ribonuclease HI family protein [Vagococcus coleopterorum]|uniref:Ribonuclease HI family protein n=1 Tax=Vagococcus coleopterorum TaxID=2714946 RepID=A0A6G8ANE2_9ENTE|nr:ribonuclease HI family protein [Vagococcus coleopterorum]QIL46490.1 ribonuclease HI family protein [Vagococcus coleopterorum]